MLSTFITATWVEVTMLWCFASREDQEADTLTTPQHDFSLYRKFFFTSEPSGDRLKNLYHRQIRFYFLYPYFEKYFSIGSCISNTCTRHSLNINRIVYCFVSQSNTLNTSDAECHFGVDLARRWFFIAIAKIPAFENNS